MKFKFQSPQIRHEYRQIHSFTYILFMIVFMYESRAEQLQKSMYGPQSQIFTFWAFAESFLTLPYIKG